jgi:hypothetical protein
MARNCYERLRRRAPDQADPKSRRAFLPGVVRTGSTRRRRAAASACPVRRPPGQGLNSWEKRRGACHLVDDAARSCAVPDLARALSDPRRRNRPRPQRPDRSTRLRRRRQCDRGGQAAEPFGLAARRGSAPRTRRWSFPSPNGRPGPGDRPPQLLGHTYPLGSPRRWRALSPEGIRGRRIRGRFGIYFLFSSS